MRIKLFKNNGLYIKFPATEDAPASPTYRLPAPRQCLFTFAPGVEKKTPGAALGHSTDVWEALLFCAMLAVRCLYFLFDWFNLFKVFLFGKIL